MAKAKEAKKTNKKAATRVQTFHNYIDGEWTKSASSEYFENINPADTSDVVGRFE